MAIDKNVLNELSVEGNCSSYPLVTVGIPVYNIPFKIFKMLFDQVTHQTYSKLDILVVDDGSNKSYQTIDYIKECSNNDKRIRFLRNEKNMGIAFTRQKIVNNILGEYFIFIDGDDYIETNFVEQMISPLLNSKYGISISCCAVKTLGNKIKGQYKTVIYDNDVLNHFFRGRFTAALCNKMLPKPIASSLVFDESKGQEDVSVMIDIFKQCRIVFRLYGTTYYYRRRRNSLSNSGSKKMVYLTFLSSKYNYECAKNLVSNLDTLRRLFAIYKLNEFILSCINYQLAEVKLQSHENILKDLEQVVLDEPGIQEGYLKKIRFVIKHPSFSKLFYKMKYRNE